MPLILQLGPLAISTERLAAVLLAWLFLAGSAWIAKRGQSVRASASWWALGAGILAARIGYVVANWPAFAVEPMAALYVWQGGFSAIAGIAAAALVQLWLLRGKALLAGLALLALLSAAWFGFTAWIQQAQRAPLPAVESLAGLDGKPVGLRREGQPLVINFWASWCPPCRREMPMLLQTAAANADVPVLLVNVGERPDAVAAFLRSEGLGSGPVRIDQGGRLSEAVGVRAMPTTLFVDGRGQIVERHMGEISRAAVHSGIARLRRREASAER